MRYCSALRAKEKRSFAVAWCVLWLVGWYKNELCEGWYTAVFGANGVGWFMDRYTVDFLFYLRLIFPLNLNKR